MESSTATTSELLINQTNIHDIQTVHKPLPPEEELESGQVLMKINSFAFTANNITYANLGKALKYWDFFPTDESWGKLPTWGFADVVASKHEAIEVGERIYGYFPMASHLLVDAVKVNPITFVDGASHRQHLAPVYNTYTRTANDPSYRKEFEALQMLFQPLFITSFLLDDFFAEQQFMGTQRILLTSASSKTATALAFILNQNKAQRSSNLQIVGLTSAKNVDFVESLGFYDEVVSYDQLTSLPTRDQVIVADFAGNRELLEGIQTHFQDQLKFISLIGASHWNKRVKGSDALGDKAVFFFAPTQAKKRMAEWGGKGFQERLAAVWIPFLKSAAQWLTVTQVTGQQALENLYQAMLAGDVNPKEGNIVNL
ncbi:MAG: DUF2855 family protein [Flammeovirgaceae bacterium]